MIEKSRSRGRPRSYDPDAVLDRAAQLFWANGFSATSLDDLSAAMGMGRPSIYNAFGDKEALFLRALQRYRDTVALTPLRALEAEDSIRQGLEAFFRQFVAYTTADRSHLGCLLGNVAPITDLPDVQRFVKTGLAAFEAQIAAHLSAAVGRGELPPDYPTQLGARRAVNAGLAISARARYGTPREELLDDAEDATSSVLGVQPLPRRSRVRRTGRT
ncbi:MAG TPA: TetR/AcrR family transcriptional regulator [Candidatus Acidoferrum sp.]|nr:TetR/AcrR family transcriptional regulator [Candidatus Acidoferrum sp.]